MKCLIYLFIIFLLLDCSKSKQKTGEVQKIDNFNLISEWKGSNNENILNFKIIDEKLIASAFLDGLIFFDIVSNGNLNFIKKWNLSSPVNYIEVLKLSNQIIGIISSYGVKIYDITDPKKIIKLNEFNDTNYFSTMTSSRIINDDILIYSSDQKKGVITYRFNIKDKTLSTNNLFQLTNDKVTTLFSYNDILLVGFEKEKIEIYKNNQLFKKIGYVVNLSVKIFVDKKYIYVSDKLNGLIIYSHNNFLLINELMRYDLPGEGYHFVIETNKILIADGSAGLKELEISNNSISMVREFKDMEIVYYCDYYKDYIYGAFGVGGIKVFKR